MERDLNNSQFEVTRIGSELKSATEQLNRQSAEIDKFNRIVQNERIEIDELLKENARLNDQVSIIGLVFVPFACNTAIASLII